MFRHLLNHHTPVERELERTTGERIEALPLLIRSLHNPGTCPIDLLPWLAWALSVDTWSPDWTEEQKRAVCKASLQIHRHKGTVGAVEDALAALGISLEIIEPKDQDPATRVPHKLQINAMVNTVFLDAEAGTKSLLDEIKSIVRHTAPARCSFILELGFEWIQASIFVVSSTPALKIRADDVTTVRLDTLEGDGEQSIAATVCLTNALKFRSNTATTERFDTLENEGEHLSATVVSLTHATVFNSCIAETAL